MAIEGWDGGVRAGWQEWPKTQAGLQRTAAIRLGSRCRRPSLDGNRLREVAWLVDVGAALQGDVIGEQLQRDVEQQRIELGLERRHLEGIVDADGSPGWGMAITGPPRGLISSTVDRFLA